MKQFNDLIKKIPKPYENGQRGIVQTEEISWYYYILFSIFYTFGINVLFTKNLFTYAILIKVMWLTFLIVTLYKSPFSFAEGFIFYTICMAYLFHFFDIFMLFFFVIFIPNGKRLLED